MTAAAALLAAILDRTEDDTPRLVFADYLEENAGTVPCPLCKGEKGRVNPNGGYREFSGAYPKWEGCYPCRGSGAVSDGNRERAEFIRLQIEAARGAAADPTMLLWGLLHHSESWFADARKVYGFEGSSWGVMHDGTVHFESKHAAGEFFVRRGFLDEARLTLAQLVGGECGRCYGEGVVNVVHPGFGSPCPACSGSGRLPGAAAALGRLPLTRITLTDREPYHIQDVYFWIHSQYPEESANTLPAAVWDSPILSHSYGPSRRANDFPTRDAALDALSTAALAYCRDQAAAPGSPA